jgi:hypothetical protein
LTGFKPLASAELLEEAGTDSEFIALRVGGSTQKWPPLALSDGKLMINVMHYFACIAEILYYNYG